MLRPALLVLILCVSAFGQSRSSAVPETVYLDVRAVDATGQFTAGLSAADFELSRGSTPLKIVKATPVDAHLNRTLVLLVDDLGLSLTGLLRVRNALRKFIAEQVKEGDRIAIVRTGKSSGQFQRLTGDRALLNAAVDRLDYNPLADPSGARPKSFTSGTLLQLRFVFDSLKNMPGRKAVVLLSERTSLPRSAGAEELSDVEAAATRIAELANQGMSSLYVIQKSRAAPQLETGLALVVKDTGGLSIDDTGDLSDALVRVCRDQDAYYLLGFQPEARAYDYMSGRDRFPQITAKVKRAGVSLRARNEVYGAVDGAGTTSADDPDDATPSPFAGEIPVQATPLFINSASEGSSFEVKMHIDTKRLTFVRGLNGRYRCVVEFASAALDAGGQVAGGADGVVTLTLNEEGYRATLETGLLYSQRIKVRKPGAYHARTMVRDEATDRVGLASQYIEVPDLSKGDLAVSGLVIKPGSTQPIDAASQVLQSAAVRVFKPGGSLGYGYEVYNVHAAGEVQVRLFRDADELFTGKPAVIPETRANATTQVITGYLTLGTDVTPGRYRFEVSATDKLQDKPRSAMQFIDFEVRN